MKKADYQWHITFLLKEGVPFTLSEMHPDFTELLARKGLQTISASLVDLNKFSSLDSDSKQLDSIVHHIHFSVSTRLRKIFRRVEKGLLSGVTRVIPSLEFEQEGVTQYAFAFPDKVFVTGDRRFYRTGE